MKTFALLLKLSTLQTQSTAKGYTHGIFASQRFHPYLGYSREDENIFFSSAITFTLKKLYTELTIEEQTIAKQLIKNSLSAYPSFKNFKGGYTYNFFKTNPMDFFPNGNIMHRFNFFKLADDADDTAYVYLTLENQEHKKLKRKLIKHANGTLRWNDFLPKKYKKLKAYGVYFGKKMHIEIDTCVLTNILIWNFKNNLPIKKQDIDSITFIKEAVISKDYINKPYIVSPCYPTTSQICYHISRLIHYNSKDYHNINKLKDTISQDIKLLLQQPKLLSIDILLLNIALLNLDTQPKTNLVINVEGMLKSTSFFYTSIPLMIPNYWARKLQKHNTLNKIFGLRTKCDAYIITLLLEYHILKNKKDL